MNEARQLENLKDTPEISAIKTLFTEITIFNYTVRLVLTEVFYQTADDSVKAIADKITFTKIIKKYFSVLDTCNTFLLSSTVLILNALLLRLHINIIKYQNEISSDNKHAETTKISEFKQIIMEQVAHSQN